MSAVPGFDRHADTYDADLNQALSVSGEEKEFFARGRVQWLGRRLRQLRHETRSAIDYGCGTGDTSALLCESLHLKSMVGLEVSPRSLEIARARHAGNGCQFLPFGEYTPRADVDLVYCNGVFHHIPPAERDASLDYIHETLRPGGIFALWENNPWNPGTRYVMSQCVFDEDAVPVAPPEGKRLLQRHEFQIISVEFVFFFPRFVKAFRFLEPYVSRIPLGAQYLVLGRKN